MHQKHNTGVFLIRSCCVFNGEVLTRKRQAGFLTAFQKVPKFIFISIHNGNNCIIFDFLLTKIYLKKYCNFGFGQVHPKLSFRCTTIGHPAEERAMMRKACRGAV